MKSFLCTMLTLCVLDMNLLFSNEASFTSSGKISTGREAPDVVTFDESIAEGAMDEEKGATDGRLAAGRKLAEEVNEASNDTSALIEAQTPPGVTSFEMLISPDAISQEIHRAAEAIDRHYAGEELTVVVLMKGALCLAADLIRALKTPCCVECIRASSYGQRGTQRGELTITGLEKFDPASKNILVVDDIFDSGQTMTRVVAELKKKSPKSLQSLVLLSKKIKREVTYRPDYMLFEIEDLFVVGYGMDYKEHYRGLPGIHVFR